MHVSTRAWATLLGLALLVIYAPALGHGFIKDDFAWIADSRVQDSDELVALLTHARGFYRPVVSLTFTVNEWLFGLNALGYGATNLALVFCVMLALGRVGRALGLASGTAVLVTVFWGLNFHAVKMSVLWISGRTALLLTLFSLLAAHATIRGRMWTAATWTMIALLSKEEAVLLPVMLLAWVALLVRDDVVVPRLEDVRSALRRGWPLLVPLGIYAVLRLQTDAMTPGATTGAYRFTLEPTLLLRNAVEYFDRAATLPLASAFVLTLLSWRRPALTLRHIRWIIMGVVWAIGGYAITLFLPIRSSLYVCLPAAGAAISGAGYLQAVWETAAHRIRQRLLFVGVTAAFVAVPALMSRNPSWVKPAELSALVLDHLVEIADTLPRDGGVLIVDDPGAETRLDQAFGTLIQTATELYLGRYVPVWIDPPPRDAAFDGRAIPDESQIVRRFAIRNGRIGDVPPE
jgi:hypothetical protein